MAEVRVGIRDGELYSSTWIVSVKATRPEFSIMSSAVHGEKFHITVHDESYGFHIVARDGSGREPTRLQLPDYLVPGVRRFVEIRIPTITAQRVEPRNAATVHWVVPHVDPTVWTTFNMVVEDPSADPDWWQERAGTLLERRPMSNLSTLAILQSRMRGYDGSWTISADTPNAPEVRAAANRGEARAIVMGTNHDKSLWMLDLPRNAISTDSSSVID